MCHAGLLLVFLLLFLVLLCIGRNGRKKDTKQDTVETNALPFKLRFRLFLRGFYITTIGIINPRFKDNTFVRAPGILAFLVAVSTGGAVVLVVLVLHSQCSILCSTVQLPLIDVGDPSYCVTLALTNDIPIFDGTQASGSLVSTTTFGKCSLLHSQACALQSWTNFMICFAAFDAWVTSAPPREFSSWIGLMVRMCMLSVQSNVHEQARCLYAETCLMDTDQFQSATFKSNAEDALGPLGLQLRCSLGMCCICYFTG